MPCFAFVAGVPLIVGGRLVVGAVTVIANAGRAALALPSLTLMTMPEKLPVVPVGGVPVNAPVCMLKVAQAGLPAIANVSGLSSGSAAVGTNVYGVPAATDVIGAPEIVGGELVVGIVTTSVNGGSDTVALPSVTAITMFA